MRKLGIIFLFFVGFLVVVYFSISTRAYPVATVNDAFISAKSFQLMVTAGEAYYSRAYAEVLAAATSSEELFKGEIRRAALQSLIEDELISQKLKIIYDPESLEVAITKRVNEALVSSSSQTEAATKAAFNLSLEDFKAIIMAPLARRELLSQELKVDAWLNSELAAASVSLALTDLKWINGRVESTGQPSYTSEIKKVFQQLASSSAQFTEEEPTSSSVDSSVE